MSWKGFLAAVFAVPSLIALAGFGILAYQIGETWDARSTDSLISGLVAVCASGAMVMVFLLALIVGVPLALRAYERGGQARQTWPEPQYRQLPPARPPAWAEQPPTIEDKSAGSWQTTGQGYDLWEEGPGLRTNVSEDVADLVN